MRRDRPARAMLLGPSRPRAQRVMFIVLGYADPNDHDHPCLAAVNEHMPEGHVMRIDPRRKSAHGRCIVWIAGPVPFTVTARFNA